VVEVGVVADEGVGLLLNLAGRLYFFGWLSCTFLTTGNIHGFALLSL